MRWEYLPVGSHKFFRGDTLLSVRFQECLVGASRAGFVNHHVWVTPYRAEERSCGQKLIRIKARGATGSFAGRSRTAPSPTPTRCVLSWYTFGHTHIPRPEDYPVMPTAYIGFLLKPNGFFTENPANDVPPSSSKKADSKGSCCGG